MASHPSVHLLTAAIAILFDDTESLRFGAAAPNANTFKLRLAEALNVFKMLLTSTRASDISEWSPVLHKQFSLEYLRESAKPRLRLLAWFHFARSAPLLPEVWQISSERLTTLVERFHFLAAFHADPLHVELLEDARGAERWLDLPTASACHWYLASEFVAPAADCAPGEFALLKALSEHTFGSLSNDRHVLHASFIHAAPTQVYSIPARGEYGATVIVLQQFQLVAIHAPYSMNHMLRSRERQRRFQVPSIRVLNFDWGPHPIPPHDDDAWNPDKPTPPRPPLHVTNLARRAHVWKRMLGPFMGSAAGMIVYGRACFPLKPVPVIGYERPNSVKTSTPEAKAFIDAILAKYMAAGIVSYCPPQFRPACVSPLSVVPKKTDPWFRLVVDLRGANLFQEDWKVRMTTLSQAAHIFAPGSFCWTRDIEAAFLISGIGGCKPGLHSRMDMGGKRYFIGCSPETCTNACTKSLLGFKWRGQYLRYEAPAFGAKLSSVLLSILLEPYLRRMRSKGVAVLCWVDDTCCCLSPLPEHRHDASACGGKDSCWMCHATWSRAIKIEREIDAEMEALGLFTNMKRTAPEQIGEFLGLGFNTSLCTFVLSQLKAASLALKAAELVSAREVSPRQLAKFRGKLSWYSPCIQGVRLLTRHINADIGGPSSPFEWDEQAPLSQAARAELVWWAEHLPAMAGKARSMWELSGEQAIRAYRSGHAAVDAMLITDASVHGWGAILRLRLPDGSEQVHATAGRWARDNDLEQAHREAAATPLALRAFRHLLPRRNVVHVSDCACVVLAQQHGSARSARLQNDAVTVWKEAHHYDYYVISGWISGTAMIDEGVDHLSREGAFDKHDVRLSPEQWTTLTNLAADQNWVISLDLFADEHATQTQAFWSSQPCGAAEGIDAFASPSWLFAHCSSCNEECQRAIHLFPPTPLLNKAVAKAKADHAFGTAVVPFMPGALWSPVLHAATISSSPLDPSEFIHGEHVENAVYSAPQPWMLVLFDFRVNGADDSCCSCSVPSVAPSRSPLHGHRAEEELRQARALLASHLGPVGDSITHLIDAAAAASLPTSRKRPREHEGPST